MTTLDGYRLRKAEALEEQARDETRELEDRIDCYHDAIAALQSLDDLGSRELNQEAWDWMLRMERAHAALKQERH